MKTFNAELINGTGVPSVPFYLGFYHFNLNNLINPLLIRPQSNLSLIKSPKIDGPSITTT
jgi:hypothetical protein